MCSADIDTPCGWELQNLRREKNTEDSFPSEFFLTRISHETNSIALRSSAASSFFETSLKSDCPDFGLFHLDESSTHL